MGSSHFSRQQILILIGLLLSLVLTVLFVVRAFQYFPNRHVNEPIRGWMSIPYIARSYHIPASVLYQATGITEIPDDHRPLMRLARAQGKPVSAIINALYQAIAKSRPPYSSPVPFPTGTALPNSAIEKTSHSGSIE
jgi:hypothetical protein